MLKRLRALIVAQMTQGATPHGLALTASFAVCLGIFPILGSTTLLCFLFALKFRLNQPLIQALNYLLYPLQIICIPFFLYIGEWLLQKPHLSIHPGDLIQQLKLDWQLFFVQYGMAGLYAVLAWLLLSPVLGCILYYSLRPLFEKLRRRLA